MDNTLVAHYDLKPPNVPVFNVSGNNLVVYEEYAHIVPGAYCTADLFNPNADLFKINRNPRDLRHHAPYREVQSLTYNPSFWSGFSSLETRDPTLWS